MIIVNNKSDLSFYSMLSLHLPGKNIICNNTHSIRIP